MSSTYQLKRLSPTHVNIANYMVANPGPALHRRTAEAFGMTQSWLSRIIRSDAFRAMLAEKQLQVQQEVVATTTEKLAGLADAAVEKLGDVLHNTQDDRLVKDITKDSLQLLGFGASKAAPGSIVNNNTQINIGVTPDALAKARAKRSQQYGGNTYLESGRDSGSDALPAPAAEVSTDSETEMGTPRDVRAELVNSET